jgi:soluble lytic murein transglycosylase-like protein
MFFEAEERPWTHHLKKPMGGLFAVSLGLLVSIADIKLPAETDRGASASLSAVSMRNIAAFYDHVWAMSGESDIDDLSETVFIPAREPAVNPYDLLIHEAAGLHDVDSDLIRAIIMVESQFNPNAKSKRGAKGLMQLMPVTAGGLDVVDLLNPHENVHAGARYIKTLLDRFDGDVKLALAAYNAGPQSVIRYDGVPPYKETRLFIARVFDYYAAFKEDALEF